MPLFMEGEYINRRKTAQTYLIYIVTYLYLLMHTTDNNVILVVY
jgi:hypothetical protein